MDTGNIARNVKPESGRGRRAAARFISASRAGFDAQWRGASVVMARSDALREAQTEAAELRAELAALRGSTAWRMTAPLRHALERLRGPKPLPAPPPEPEPLAYVPLDYGAWIARQEPELKRLLGEELPGHGQIWAPRLALLVLGESAQPAQPECEIFHLHDADPFEFAMALDVDFIGFHDPRDQLAPDALALMAHALARAPETALAFADEDWLDANGARATPFFKPGWDWELARGRDLIGPFAFFRASLLRAASPPRGAAWLAELAGQIAAMAPPEQILHIPAVLCHRVAPAPPPGDALALRLARESLAARLQPLPGAPGLHRVVYDLPPVAPLVSILICTRDRADLLRPCMHGILHETDYPRFEVILVDHASTAADALALLQDLAADPRVKILRDSGAFNWARLNNAAAAHAQGEILLLLNNDIAVLEPGWLRELVAQAVQPGVGAVGAKLLYPDGRIQHAGLTVDAAGVPTHLYRFAPALAAGMSDTLRLAREVWAVTGACMAMPRAVFRQLGGLNEALAVACNDVEFCLRLGALGYRVIFTPWCVLEHHEQATRLPDNTDEKRARALSELDRLLRDWGALALHDPYLNPNLMLFEEQPVLRERAVG